MMRKTWNRILSVAVCLLLAFSLAACGNDGKEPTEYEDFYEFDTSSFLTEQLVGREQVLAPVVKNLGSVVEDAKYGLTITLDGTDVTGTAYTASTKTFLPQTAGDYTLTFTAHRPDDTVAQDKNDKPFTKTVAISAVAMNFEPNASAGQDVTVNNEDANHPAITFGPSYASTNSETSGQYRVTGLSFTGNYKLTYRFKDIKSNPAVAEPRILFGVYRSDELGRDDNFYLNMAQGNMGCWFFNDAGPAASGDDWTGTGWKTTTKSVSGYQPVTGEHTISFIRIVENSDAAYAHYVVEYDGVPFTAIDVKQNYTDRLRGVWVESEGVSGTVSVEGFESLTFAGDAPAIEADYPVAYAGEPYDLKSAVTVTDSAGFGGFAGLSFQVTAADGTPAVLSGSIFTPAAAGDYSVRITARDLAGNTATETKILRVAANFGFGNFGDSYLADTEIEFAPAFYSASDEEKASVTVAVLLDGAPTSVAVTGDGASGFRFTIAEGGIYTLQVGMTVDGRQITRQKTFTVTDPNAVSIRVDRTTDVARLGVGHVLYYTVTDPNSGDKTADAAVKMLFGEDLAAAIDVTAETLSVLTSKTTAAEDTLTFPVFRPDREGTFWLRVSYTNERGKQAAAVHKIQAAAGTEWVYGNKLDMGNGNPGKMTVGIDTLILDGVGPGGNTSKYIIDNLDVKDNWTLSFQITDLAYAAQGKFFATLGMKPNSGIGDWKWDDITVGGNVKEDGSPDLWGFETCLAGTGWVTYQWKGTWQEPITDIYCPLDPDTGEKVPFREAGEYAQYAAGTHEYQIVCRKDAESGELVYSYYIDGRPEARHVADPSHNEYSTVGCVVFMSEKMNGIVTGLSIVQD